MVKVSRAHPTFPFQDLIGSTMCLQLFISLRRTASRRTRMLSPTSLVEQVLFAGVWADDGRETPHRCLVKSFDCCRNEKATLLLVSWLPHCTCSPMLDMINTYKGINLSIVLSVGLNDDYT
eukprot:scpid80304/ scgid9237/ 